MGYYESCWYYESNGLGFANLISKTHKATPNQSLVSGHPPAWYFENPIYKDYNDIHSNDDVKWRVESHDTLMSSCSLPLHAAFLKHMVDESVLIRIPEWTMTLVNCAVVHPLCDIVLSFCAHLNCYVLEQLCVHTFPVVCTLRFAGHASVVWFKYFLFVS